MIKITIYQNQGETRGFFCEGHADYAEYGKDIVCSAVSILVINTINGIEQFTEDAFTLDVPKEEAPEGINDISFRLTDTVSEGTSVLLKTLVLGLTEIQEMYGDSYLTLNFKEV